MNIPAGRPLLVLLAVAALAPSPSVQAHRDFRGRPDDLVVRWNDAFLQAVRNVRFAPTLTARAAAIVHTSIYDAWAAYDRKALATRTGASLRQPREARTIENKRIAVSYAAYRALVDLFPSEKEALFDAMLLELGLDPDDASTDPTTPMGLETLPHPLFSPFATPTDRTSSETSTAGSVLGLHRLSAGERPRPARRSRPLAASHDFDGSPELSHSSLEARHSLRAGIGVRAPAPAASDLPFAPLPPAGRSHPKTQRRAYRPPEDDRGVLGRRTFDRDAARSLEPARPCRLPEGSTLSPRRREGLLHSGNALLDASIAVWACKVYYDYVRPVSAVRLMSG